MKTVANDRDRAHLLKRLRRVRPDSARRWGRMSAHQMVCHLSDAFHMASGDRTVSDASSLWGRTVMRWLALYVPLSWPSGIMTRPELDQTMGGTRPRDFASDLAECCARLEALAAVADRDDWPPHPIFGPMSRAAWCRWAYLHTDHHLRQFGA
jgi:hypothetical protein